MATSKPCKFCGEDIIWVTTAKGKRMPIDVDPVSNGQFILDGDPDERGSQKVAYIGDNDKYRGARYSSHFGTCKKRERRED